MNPNTALASILAGLALLAVSGILGAAGILPFFDPAIDAPNQTINTSERATPPEPTTPPSQQPAPSPPPPAPSPPPSSPPAPATPPSQPTPAPAPATPPPQEKTPPRPVPPPVPASTPQPRRGIPEIAYYTFDKAEPGALPSGWTAIRGAWIARQDPKALSGTGTHVLAQITELGSGADAIAISNDTIMKNVQASANLRISSTTKNQTAGVVFRYQDPLNYYTVGLDALNQRVTFYKTVAGITRIVYFASTNRIRANEWNYLSAAATGEHIRVRLNDDNYISIKETTFSEGKSGLWTLGATSAVFDNAEVKKLP